MSHDEAEEVRFVADKMLGRLARWLRIMGRDVKYGPQLSGRGLLKEARRENRWILTRDRRIARTKNIPPTLFIQSDHFREQVRQVVGALRLDPLSKLFTRCVVCNEPLSPISKGEVEGRVPAYVFATEESFVVCRGCHRIYWPATHRKRMLQELSRFLGDVVHCTEEGGGYGHS